MENVLVLLIIVKLMTRAKSAGGFHSVLYTLKMARKSGSLRDFYKVLRSNNVCKTCALGQKKMRNEIDQGFQVCKKAMQAVAQDLLDGIDDGFFEEHSIEDLAGMKGIDLENAGRITTPLYAKEGDTHYRPITWQKTYQIMIDSLEEVDPDRMFFYTSGRSSNEAAFLAQLMARNKGTNNVNNCSYYCHQASGVGLKQTIGSGTSTVMLEDVEKADMVVVIGANPSSNHPRFITHLIDVRKRGGKVAIVNPFREVGLEYFKIPSRPLSLVFGKDSKVSDMYLQPHCGGDMAFLKAIAANLVQSGDYDKDFVEKYTNNFDDLKKDLEKADIDNLLVKSGIPVKQFEKFYDMLLNHDNVIFSWAMGITHQKHGVETVRMLANVQLLLGNIGREGAGLLPLRGHSNVQGVGSVGVVPKLKPEIVDLMAEHMDLTVPPTEGKDTFSSMEAAHDGGIDLAIMLGGNLYGANPNSDWASNALNNIETTIYISTTLNLGHFHGKGKNSLIIPVRVREEEKQPTSQESMFNYIRISEGGFEAPVPALPTEVELLTHVGKTLWGNDKVPWEDFEDHTIIREYIAKTVPYLKDMANLNTDGGEFTIPGRIKHKPEFNTDNGKANLFIGEAPDGRPKDGKYNLLTFRSEEQFNTIVYDEKDPYRGSDHRMVLFMNKRDIGKNDFKDGQWVQISSQVGSENVQILEAPIRSGNVAMFYPEGNRIVPSEIDPQSKTPSFKKTSVAIELIDD